MPKELAREKWGHLTSSKIIVLVAQPPISTDGGPPAWAVDKRAELRWQVAGEKGGQLSVKVAHVYV